MIRTLSVLLMSAMAGAVIQQTEPMALTDRDRDVYAIYSLLLTNPPTPIPVATDAPYWIAAETRPLSLVLPADSNELWKQLWSRCNAPPDGYESKWQEILADYTPEKDIPAMLLRQFNIQRSYVLIKKDEFGSGTNPGVVFALSNIWFNKDRTLAATRILATSCGTLCGHSERSVYERLSDGGWKEVVETNRCTMDA